jgi:ParB family transcriptional regulator, chromosome partitioning protein
MTSSAAKAGQSGEKEKEKTGIRRALGRGLDSLLPGPRVVRPGTSQPLGSAGDELRSAGQPGAAVPTQTGTRAGVAGSQIQGGGAAGEQQVPHFVRNDNASSEVVGTIQAVADGAVGESPLLAKDARSGAPGASLHAGGEPGATVGAEVRSASPALRPVSALHAQDTRAVAGYESTESITIQASAQSESRTPSNLVVQIPLDHIDSNPYQTRYLFDETMLRELAESIRAQGVVQPVVVRPGEDGRYVLILGERRCRASKLAGKTSIPAIVRRVSDQQAAEMTIIENLQREDLNCMEQAEAFGVLSKEFNLTQEQIGARVGLSRESVSNYMRLLKLPETVMEYLATNKLTFSDARELMMIDDPKLIAKAADLVVKKHLSVEKIEDLVMEMQGLGPAKPPSNRHGARWVDPNVKAAQGELERLLGVRVRIRDRRGKGKIVIEYATVDDYERVVEALKGKK